MVPIMYEWGEVKTVPGNKIVIIIYSWTVWVGDFYETGIEIWAGFGPVGITEKKPFP